MISLGLVVCLSNWIYSTNNWSAFPLLTDQLHTLIFYKNIWKYYGTYLISLWDLLIFKTAVGFILVENDADI